jgi:hypothetical protein
MRFWLGVLIFGIVGLGAVGFAAAELFDVIW